MPTNDSKRVSGTIYGSYDYNFESKGAWVGHVIFNIDGRSMKARFVDRNNSITRKPVEVCATFTGTPASTPGLYTLDETGTIANGTGAYRHVSGKVAVKGPFLFPDPGLTPGLPPWIAEIHGVLDGV